MNDPCSYFHHIDSHSRCIVRSQAPEIITMKPDTNPYTPFSDVYAFGMVMYEMLTMQVRVIVCVHRYIYIYVRVSVCI